MSLDSDVAHYSDFVGLRDRFDLSAWGLGLFDVGLGFSHLGFQQDFNFWAEPLNGGLSGQYVEELNTDYYGADVRSTFHRCLAGYHVMLDLNVGIYDMTADYAGRSLFRTAAGNVFDNWRLLNPHGLPALGFGPGVTGSMP